MSRKENMWGQPPSTVRSDRTRHFLAWSAIAVVVLALFPALSPGQSGTPKLTENLPAGTMQQKATTACTECHEGRIILQQRLGKTAWTKEVDKMIKWGAVVDASDHDALIDYLSTNFGVDQPAYQAPRSAAAATNKKPSK
jgi:hypothetical protein